MNHSHVTNVLELFKDKNKHMCVGKNVVSFGINKLYAILFFSQKNLDLGKKIVLKCRITQDWKNKTKFAVETNKKICKIVCELIITVIKMF